MLVEQKKKRLYTGTTGCEIVWSQMLFASLGCAETVDKLVSEISNLQPSMNIGLMKATFRCTRLFCYPLRKRIIQFQRPFRHSFNHGGI